MAIYPDLSGNHPEGVPPFDAHIAEEGEGADGATIIAGANGTSAATASNPLPVNAPGSGGVSTVYADQQVVTATATALTTQALINGVIIKAKSTNTGKVFIGAAGVNATDDGTGTGFALNPGDAVSIPISTTAGLFVIGTLNDIIYVMGN